MNQPPLIFLGMFGVMAMSWFSLVLMPQLQIGRQEPTESLETKELYPQSKAGMAEQGREVYRSLGCVSCHTQQVRSSSDDIPRFGPRGSVAADYLYDSPALVGWIRIGPDLSNVALRMPASDWEKWHYKHLYRPRTLVKGSTMPPYKFLFEQRARGEQPAPDALELEGEDAPPTGFEVVPGPKGRALIAYLRSLRSDTYLFERPPLTAPKPAVADTNAVPDVATNAVPVAFNR